MKPTIPEKDAMEVILRARGFAQAGYRFWSGIYGFLILTSIAAPALAATEIFPSIYSRLLAVAGAVAASFLGVLRPHDYLTRYDNALQMLWQTRVGHILNTLSIEEVSVQVQKAIELMKLSYSTVTEGSPSSSDKA